MEIIFNGERKYYEEGSTVSTFIKQERVNTRLHFSIFVNKDSIIPEEFDTTVLHDGDKLELLYLAGGGTV